MKQSTWIILGIVGALGLLGFFLWMRTKSHPADGGVFGQLTGILGGSTNVAAAGVGLGQTVASGGVGIAATVVGGATGIVKDIGSTTVDIAKDATHILTFGLL